MTKLLFDVKGTLKVDGVLINSEKQVEVELDGHLITGGCTDAAIAKAIGIKNILTAIDHDEVLSHYSLDDFTDHIINNKSLSDSQIKQMSMLLAQSLD